MQKNTSDRLWRFYPRFWRNQQKTLFGTAGRVCEAVDPVQRRSFSVYQSTVYGGSGKWAGGGDLFFKLFNHEKTRGLESRWPHLRRKDLVSV